MLAPHLNVFGPRLRGSSSFAGVEGLTTQRKQAIPIPPLSIGQQPQITWLLNDVTQETPRVFQQLAVFASTVHIPQKTGRPIHQHHRPSLGLVWGDLLVHSGV